MTSGEFGEVAVERSDEVGIVGDGPISGDGWTVAALEVVAKRLQGQQSGQRSRFGVARSRR